MLGFRLIRFVPIAKHQNEYTGEECLMRFPDGSTDTGWYSEDDGWHYSRVADHLDFPCDPQPTHYAKLPKT